MKTVCVLLSCVVAAGAFARPVLYPEVKEYAASGGSFSTESLQVFYENQTQCALAADETFVKGGKSVWNGRTASDAGVYVAVAGSAAGRKLVSDFGLDVPAKKQGYAIAAENGRVAIVGFDPVGVLYGAVTFAQMSKGGRVEAARVRDWPDILYRGSMSFGRGLWELNGGDPEDGRAEAIKAGLDMMLRHKLNIFCDIFRVQLDSDPARFALVRELCHYAADRGIFANDYASSALWLRRNVPKDIEYDKWPCVKSHSPWDDEYYCWSDDEATEAAANRYADHALNLGIEKGIIIIHPVDGGTWRDPETWSQRCARCRARWNDHERWKASVNQFDIWMRVLRRRLPEAMVGSCIYPYKFNELLTPEKDRTPQWYEGNADYWRQLSAGMEDKRFFFSSWICSPVVFKEFRRLVPDRALHFSDAYPIGAGIFHTFHRKAASIWEPQSENVFSTQSTDGQGRWESVLLVSEYTWNKDAPGAERYDGGTYYDPLVDHTGPKPVVEEVLPRLCQTFWGEKLAPHLHRILTSGVMPEYIKNPAATVQYWNDTRKNPEYDPNVLDSGRGKPSLEPIVDTTELMRAQVAAAELCVRELESARGCLEGLDRYKRKYLMAFAKDAPFWLATARTLLTVRRANEQISKGETTAALTTLMEGRSMVEADFARAASELRSLTGEKDTLGWHYAWPRDVAWARTLLDRAEASAKVTLQPRKIGRKVRLGIVGAEWRKGVKEYFDDYENVEVKLFDSISLAELDRFDCVILTDDTYDKGEFFSNLKSYVERGGGGVYLEGALCGHKRFEERTPFPEIAARSSGYFENFPQKMKFADGREGKTMYVDYFGIEPGAKGEVMAYGPDGKTPLAVRGASGLGKVFFCGTFNLGTYDGSFAEKVERLHGANAELAKGAVEYLTGVRLKRKGE